MVLCLWTWVERGSVGVGGGTVYIFTFSKHKNLKKLDKSMCRLLFYYPRGVIWEQNAPSPIGFHFSVANNLQRWGLVWHCIKLCCNDNWIGFCVETENTAEVVWFADWRVGLGFAPAALAAGKRTRSQEVSELFNFCWS